MTQDPSCSLHDQSSVLWAGPRLLVPMYVEALLVTDKTRADRWSRAENDYGRMYEFGQVEPEPFKTSDGPAAGVLLKWAVPDAITHGREVGDAGARDQQIDFPKIPNRWLVVRTVYPKADFELPSSTGWVLESDVQSDDGAPFPDEETQAQIRLGRITRLRDWTGEAPDSPEPFLTAIGPGTSTFAAYQPSNKHILSFHDDLKHENGDFVAFGRVSYVVLGWYSVPSVDPMFGAWMFDSSGWSTKFEWRRLMDANLWSVGEEKDGGEEYVEEAKAASRDWFTRHGVARMTGPHGTLPAQSLCTGIVFGLEWKGLDDEPPSDRPSDKPSIAFGNTAVDALAAMLSASMPQKLDEPSIRDLLEAFQYDSLEIFQQPDWRARLDQLIHAAWFGSSSAGDYFVVREKDRQGLPDLFDGESKTLRNLNTKQTELDRLEQTLRSAQWQLWSAWWKLRLHEVDPPKGPKDDQGGDLSERLQKAYDEAKARVKAILEQERPALVARRDTLESELRELLRRPRNGEPRDLELQRDLVPKLDSFNDPVLLISGARRSFGHGESERLGPSSFVFTRFTGQTLAGIDIPSVDGTEHVTLTVDELDVPLPEGIDAESIPKEALDLCLETFLLDTSTAGLVRDEAEKRIQDPVDEDTIRKMQTLVWNKELYPVQDRTIAELSGLVGQPLPDVRDSAPKAQFRPPTIPSKLSVEAWVQPWSPLYLDWKIRWFPSSSTQKDVLKKWRFDGTDFRWQGNEPPSRQYEFIYHGRTLLTPKTSFSLEEQLRKFIKDFGDLDSNPIVEEDLPEIEAFLEGIGNYDLLSQSLSGLANQMVLRSDSEHRSAPDFLEALTADQSGSTPNPSRDPGSGLEDDGVAAGETTEVAPFFPIRAGHFQLMDVWVVDDFGQVYEPLSVLGIKPDQYEPILPPSLQTPSDRRLVQLAPRAAPASRIDLRFQSAAPPDVDSRLDPNRASPVCGFVVMNYVDGSLLIYDAEGAMLGEVVLVQRSAQEEAEEAIWRHAPGTRVPLGAPPPIKNGYMREFVNQLLGMPSGGADAFKSLLSAIDHSAWQMLPLNAPSARSSVELTSRVFVVARARVNLVFDGMPVTDPSWSATGKEDTHGYPNVEFPVQVGSGQLLDDGLIGYFSGDDYSVFHSLYADGGSPYVQDRDLSLKFSDDVGIPLTMLLDPRGMVYASNGISPAFSMDLPSEYYIDALSRIDVTFACRPVMQEPSTVRMPLPHEIQGNWSWVYQESVMSWKEDGDIKEANDMARLGDAPSEVFEGWLKLSGSQAPEGSPDA